MLLYFFKFFCINRTKKYYFLLSGFVNITKKWSTDKMFVFYVRSNNTRVWTNRHGESTINQSRKSFKTIFIFPIQKRNFFYLSLLVYSLLLLLIWSELKLKLNMFRKQYSLLHFYLSVQLYCNCSKSIFPATKESVMTKQSAWVDPNVQQFLLYFSLLQTKIPMPRLILLESTTKVNFHCCWTFLCKK